MILFYSILCYRMMIGGGYMRPLKESISITIDGDVLAAIKIKAEECDRSVSQYINLVLKDHLKKEAQK